MPRVLAGFALSAAILFLVSCEDETTEEKALVPTAPAPVAPAVALMNAPAKVKGSR